MGIDLVIKDVPAEQVERLRLQALAHGRSLEEELRALVDSVTAAAPPRNGVQEVLAHVRSLGLSRAPAGEAARMIREDRDREDH